MTFLNNNHINYEVLEQHVDADLSMSHYEYSELRESKANKFKKVDFTQVPTDSNTFDSVSAFDFLEHIPRQIHLSANSMPRLPFVELMNEVWRVLKPGGKFYAMTPGYPNPAAFVDPTHVNFITEDTHMYFCGVKPIGKIYGFYGKFEVLRCERVIPKDSFEPDVSISKVMRKWHRKLMKPSGLSHIVWELKAGK